MQDPRDVSSAVERAFREESGRVLATLIRHLGGDFQLAEDALQDAFAVALATWPRDGVPANPGAWITTAARRKAIDRLRRERALPTTACRACRRSWSSTATTSRRRSPRTSRRRRRPPAPRLHLLSPGAARCDARVALTLRTLGGLTTARDRARLPGARADDGPAPRARQAQDRRGRHPLPRAAGDAELPDRLAGVLAVVYLVFNEGYARQRGRRASCARELCAEAIRLGPPARAGSCPTTPRPPACWRSCSSTTRAATPASAATGATSPLPDQDRARWDARPIAEGRAQLDRALRLRRTGPVPAAGRDRLAALRGADAEVDWPQIAALYRLLACMAPSPVVEVNRAVALGMAGQPRRGPRAARRASALDRYQPFHVARAELLRRSGDDEAADGAYARAIELSANAVERAELERRRGSPRTSGPRR